MVASAVSPSTARQLRTASLLRVLRAVHDAPVPPTRAAVTRPVSYTHLTLPTIYSV